MVAERDRFGGTHGWPQQNRSDGTYSAEAG